MRSATAIAILAFGMAPFVAAHGKITAATGDAGGKTAGLAVGSATGTNQGDTTIFKQQTGFGKTNKGGAIDAETAVPAAQKFAQSDTLPQVSQGGTVSMTLHQLNGDGAGPYTCAMSADATGQEWTDIPVTQQVPGTKGRSKAKDQDFPLAAQVPAGTQCTGSVGGQTGVCMVKCQNPVGPFGGTVAIQMAGGNATTAGAGTAATGGAAAGTAATGAAAGTAGTTETGKAAKGATTGTTETGKAAKGATGATGTTGTASTTGTAGAAGNNKNASKNANKNNRRAHDSFECADESCLDFDDSAATAEKRDGELACTDASCLDFDDSESTTSKRSGPVAVRSFLERQ